MTIYRDPGRKKSAWWRLLMLMVALAIVAAACDNDDDSSVAEQPVSESGDSAPEEETGSGSAGSEQTSDAGSEQTSDAGSEQTSDAGDEQTSDAGDEQTSEDSSAPSEPLEVLFLYSGVANDQGWSQTFDMARQELEATFAGEIATSFREGLFGAGPEQIISVIDNAVLDGVDVVVGNSFEQGEPMLASAATHSDVVFLMSQWDNPGDLDNFAGFVNAPEDGSYIMGVIAGHMIEAGGTVGWIDAFPIPYDLRTMNGFALGLQHSNPTATLNAVFTNDWVDETLFGQAARSTIDAGASFIATSIGSPAVGEAAESAGLPFAGVQLDASRFAPTSTISTVEYTWAPLIEGFIRSILNGGEFDTTFAYQGMSDGVITLTGWGPMYDSLGEQAKADIEAEMARIKAAPFSVFVGPITDANGNMVVGEGESLSVDQLRSMDWIMPNVRGIDL